MMRRSPQRSHHMNATLQALLGLQDIDRHIFRVESELKRLPKELELRQELLTTLESRLQEKQKAAQEIRTRVKELEDITTGLRQRLRKLENESNKPGVDAALLAHYHHEMGSIKKTVSQAEDDALKELEEVEGLEREAGEIEARFNEERVVFDEFKGNVEREIAAAEARQSELLGQRAERGLGEIPAPQMELYDRILKTREGEALALLDGQVCQGCYVSIPKNLAVRLARGAELIQCPSCDRILYSTL